MKNDNLTSSKHFLNPTINGTANSLHLTDYNETCSSIRKTTPYFESMPTEQSQITTVAKWFLHKESMSNKKLQKICYYAYAWFLVFFNDVESFSRNLNSLSRSGFQAWVHGPVSPELYALYRGYGWNDIPSVETPPAFPEDVVDVFEQVWNIYGKFSADQLERLTHKELPWQDARKGLSPDEPSTQRMDDWVIFNYYSKMMAG